MSVNESLTLPNQPTQGSVVIRPLGGDGYTSPQSYYIASHQVDSDASGGTVTNNIVTDPQFQSVIAVANVSMISGAADRLVAIGMFTEESAVRLEVIANMVLDSDVGQHLLYSPAPLFPCPRIRCVVDNVDTEETTLKLVVYNFKRDAFQKVPLSVLLDSLPRGFSIQ